MMPWMMKAGTGNGWAAFHQDELKENWALAEKQQELFSIDSMK